MSKFIYHFTSPDGNLTKESISFQEEKLTDEQIEEIKPIGTEFYQYVEIDIVAGDFDLLPRERELRVVGLGL